MKLHLCLRLREIELINSMYSEVSNNILQITKYMSTASNLFSFFSLLRDRLVEIYQIHIFTRGGILYPLNRWVKVPYPLNSCGKNLGPLLLAHRVDYNGIWYNSHQPLASYFLSTGRFTT